MTDREKFILKFINRYYHKSQRKRRSSKNQAHYIARTVNNVSKTYFHRKLEFTEEEIFKAFERNKFTLMESGKGEFTWERFHEGNILISCDLFININPQSNHDLKLVMKRSYPPKWKAETVERIDNLRADINKFWGQNGNKISFEDK